MRSTMISRCSDGLALAASIDDEATETKLAEQKQQAKLVLRRVTPQSEPQCTIESGPCSIHYVIANDIVYLTIADKSYPRKLAFSYLDELSKEFERSFGDEARKPGLRPYAFVKFDSFIQRTKRLYQDSRAAEAATQGSGLDRLNSELREVSTIMTKNIEDLLWRGDNLDRMSSMSTALRDESLKYRKAAKKINFDALVRKWAPVGIIGFMFVLVLWIKFG